MADAIFTVLLDAEDWDRELGGWRCPVLRVPGARIHHVFVEGVRQPEGCCEALAEEAVVRWVQGERPARLALTLLLPTDLVPAAAVEEARKGAAGREWRLKVLTVLLPFVSAVAVALIGYLPKYTESKNLGGQLQGCRDELQGVRQAGQEHDRLLRDRLCPGRSLNEQELTACITRAGIHRSLSERGLAAQDCDAGYRARSCTPLHEPGELLTRLDCAAGQLIREFDRSGLLAWDFYENTAQCASEASRRLTGRETRPFTRLVTYATLGFLTEGVPTESSHRLCSIARSALQRACQLDLCYASSLSAEVNLALRYFSEACGSTNLCDTPAGYREVCDSLNLARDQLTRIGVQLDDLPREQTAEAQEQLDRSRAELDRLRQSVERSKEVQPQEVLAEVRKFTAQQAAPAYGSANRAMIRSYRAMPRSRTSPSFRQLEQLARKVPEDGDADRLEQYLRQLETAREKLEQELQDAAALSAGSTAPPR